VFTVDVKEVRQRMPAVVDDELAVGIGLENLAELRQELRQQMERDYAAASRLRLKRALLDKLAERYDFPVPLGMVDMEFDNIWAHHQAERELQQEPDVDSGETSAAVVSDGPTGVAEIGQSPAADAAAPDGGSQLPGEDRGAADDDQEAAKAEYRKIAERRIRLGLLLAEVGNSNNITVTQEELNQAIAREVRRHPGYERQALDFYRQNPEAVANLRAPIFEDKVVDFIVEMAKVPERRVSPQELLALPEPDDANAVSAPASAEASA
jgi:trigger factor